MTQDEIIELARQAGVRDDEHTFEFSQYKYLERFAKLVAEKEREACAKAVEKIETYEKIEKYCFKFAGKTIRTRGQA